MNKNGGQQHTDSSSINSSHMPYTGQMTTSSMLIIMATINMISILVICITTIIINITNSCMIINIIIIMMRVIRRVAEIERGRGPAPEGGVGSRPQLPSARGAASDIL